MSPGAPATSALRRFRRHKPAVASLCVLTTLAVLAAGAGVIEWLLGLDAEAVDLASRMQPPSAAHWLGTDELGRDVLVRLLYGAQVSLFVGLTAALAAAFVGTVVGLTSGYFGGRTDTILMRFTDSVLALPALPLLVVIAAVDAGKVLPVGVADSGTADLIRIVIIVALLSWTTVARLVRAESLALTRQGFVLAAAGMGVGNRAIMFRHILPNLLTPVIVAVTLCIGQVILLESVLSFLGLGIQPPVASWGNMLTNAQEIVWEAPTLAVYPGLCIFVTVAAFNLVGDGLQAALDPRGN